MATIELPTRSPIRLRAVLAQELVRIIDGFEREAGLLALSSATYAELDRLRVALGGDRS